MARQTAAPGELGLKKSLGLFEVTVYAVGNILGAGIYALIGEAAGLTGGSLWLAFLVGAIVASLTGLSYAELSTMMPRAAAEYTYLRACGSKMLAFLIGWLILFTGVFSSATVALGFGGYFHGLFGVPAVPVAITLIAVLSLVSFWGIKESARFNLVFTAVEAAGLVLVVVLGLTAGTNRVDYFEMTDGLSGLLAAAGLVFFAYIGFEDIANISEETKKPQEVLARAFFLAVIITTVVYVLTSIAAVTLASPGDLSGSGSPLATAVSKTFLGDRAFTLLSYIALFATANTVLVLIIVGTRMAYGMAREGSFPKALGAVHLSRQTPHVAIAVVAGLAAAFALIGKIGVVASLTSLGAFLTFGLVNVALVWLRYKRPDAERPFKAPLNIGRFPVPAFLGIVTCIAMSFQFGLDIVAYTAGALAAGLVLYFVMERRLVG